MCYNKDTVKIHRANSKFEGDGGDGNGFYADGSKIPYSKKKAARCTGVRLQQRKCVAPMCNPHEGARVRNGPPDVSHERILLLPSPQECLLVGAISYVVQKKGILILKTNNRKCS